MKVWKNLFSKIAVCETRNKRFAKFIVNRYFDYVLLFLIPIQWITLKTNPLDPLHKSSGKRDFLYDARGKREMKK